MIKFRLDELKVSFLSYPEFLDKRTPGPASCYYGGHGYRKWRQIDYSGNINPPILHRKEALLPPDHPRRAVFAALTQTEEAEGLYEHTNTIGFKLNWERLLAQEGLALQGHQLCRVVNGATPARSISRVPHSTLQDGDHSITSVLQAGEKPVGVWPASNGNRFFDYGCGQGADVNGLRALGYEANGWDPVYRPHCSLVTADVVNLGYVINVIEDPAERLETLCNAHRLARKLLVVSALIQKTVQSSSVLPFSDGLLTRRKTFQKFYDQQEFQQFIEDALESTAIPVALGVFYVFRDSAEQQDFISARTRHSIDWNQISSRLVSDSRGLARFESVLISTSSTRTCSMSSGPCFWNSAGSSRDEFPRFDELRQAVRSPKRAEKLFLEREAGKSWREPARLAGTTFSFISPCLETCENPSPSAAFHRA